jgi:hypothetical protein
MKHVELVPGVIEATGSSGDGKFSRHKVLELHMRFVIDWDPLRFAEEQQYNAALGHVLAHAITLTGYGNSLQAATCADYIKQTWPETGTQLLSLIQASAEGGSGGSEGSMALS